MCLLDCACTYQPVAYKTPTRPCAQHPSRISAPSYLCACSTAQQTPVVVTPSIQKASQYRGSRFFLRKRKQGASASAAAAAAATTGRIPSGLAWASPWVKVSKRRHCPPATPPVCMRQARADAHHSLSFHSTVYCVPTLSTLPVFPAYHSPGSVAGRHFFFLGSPRRLPSTDHTARLGGFFSTHLTSPDLGSAVPVLRVLTESPSALSTYSHSPTLPSTIPPSSASCARANTFNQFLTANSRQPGALCPRLKPAVEDWFALRSRQSTRPPRFANPIQQKPACPAFTLERSAAAYLHFRRRDT